MPNLNVAIADYIESNVISHGFSSYKQLKEALFALSQDERENLIETTKQKIIATGKVKITQHVKERNSADSKVLAFAIGLCLFAGSAKLSGSSCVGVVVGMAAAYLSQPFIYTFFNETEALKKLGERVKQTIRADDLLKNDLHLLTQPASLYQTFVTLFAAKRHPLETAAIDSALAISPISH